MHLSQRGAIAVWGFVIMALLAFWGGRVAWATSDQSPAYQTVPTRVKSPTPGPPTNTPIPPTETRRPPTNTPIPPRAATTAPSPSAPAAATLPPPNTPVPGVTATAKDNLRVRGSPSTSAAIVGQLKKGDTVQIVGRSPANDWWQVPLPANPNVRGWISAEFAVTNGPVDSIPVIKGSIGSTSTPTPNILAAPTEKPFLPTTIAPARAEISPQTTNTPSAPVIPVDIVEPAEPIHPMTTIVVGLVLLGIGGGFVLIMIGVVVMVLNRG